VTQTLARDGKFKSLFWLNKRPASVREATALQKYPEYASHRKLTTDTEKRA